MSTIQRQASRGREPQQRAEPVPADEPASHRQLVTETGRKTLPLGMKLTLPRPGDAAPARAAAEATAATFRIPRPDRTTSHPDEEAGRPTRPLMMVVAPEAAPRADPPPVPARQPREGKQTQVGLGPPPAPAREPGRSSVVRGETLKHPAEGAPALPVKHPGRRAPVAPPAPEPDTPSRPAMLPPVEGADPTPAAIVHPPLPSPLATAYQPARPHPTRVRQRHRSQWRWAAFTSLGIILFCTLAAAAIVVGSRLQTAPPKAAAPPPPTAAADEPAHDSLVTKLGATPSHAEGLPSAMASDAAPNEPAKPTGAVAVPWLAPAITKAPRCNALVGVEGQDLQPYLLQQALARGQAEFMRGNLEKAQAAYCEAQLLGDTSANVAWTLTQILLLRGDPEAALEVVDRILEQQPGDPRTLELRGDVLIRLGRVDAARDAWLRAAGAPRASDLVVNNLLRANRAGLQSALSGGDLVRADRMARRILAFDSQDASAAAELAAVSARLGRQRSARRWLEYAASLEGDHPRVRALQKTLVGHG